MQSSLPSHAINDNDAHSGKWEESKHQIAGILAGAYDLLGEQLLNIIFEPLIEASLQNPILRKNIEPYIKEAERNPALVSHYFFGTTSSDVSKWFGTLGVLSIILQYICASA